MHDLTGSTCDNGTKQNDCTRSCPFSSFSIFLLEQWKVCVISISPIDRVIVKFCVVRNYVSLAVDRICIVIFTGGEFVLVDGNENVFRAGKY